MNELELALRVLGQGAELVDIDVVLGYMGITLGDLVDLVTQSKGRFDFDYSDEVVKKVGFVTRRVG